MTAVDEGRTCPLAYMEKSKTAGFTHSQFLCYILVLGFGVILSWCMTSPTINVN